MKSSSTYLGTLSPLFVTAALVLGLPACGGGSGDAITDGLARLKKFERDVCDCKDAACALTQYEDYRAWADAAWPKLEAARPTAQQWDELNSFDQVIRLCYRGRDPGGER